MPSPRPPRSRALPQRAPRPAKAESVAASTRRPRALAAVEGDFRQLLATVQGKVEGRLDAVLRARVAAAADDGREVVDMVEAVHDLCSRGGKRLRPALVVVGLHSVGAPRPELLDSAYSVGVALELLQAYFLLHDDWMDQDDERRGGPTAHRHLARRYRDAHKGACSAILAGDYAAGLATATLSDLSLPPRRAAALWRSFAAMQLAAVRGQQLDVIGKTRDVEHTYALKTASYTVQGPLELGAHLAGASARVHEALAAFSQPAGIAFQLRDDLIGVFGDPAKTGKPRGGDLTAGKYTLLVHLGLTRAKGAQRAALRRVLGDAAAPRRQVEAAIDLLESCGALAEVEQRITRLTEAARAPLAALRPGGRQLLNGALDTLTVRQS